MNWKMGTSLIAMVAMLSIGATDALAGGGKTVWEDGDKSLSLLGDLRFRYEQDNDNTKTGTNSTKRTRQRVRLRFGGVYKASSAIEAGFRLATGSNSLHSPHQDLGQGTAGAKNTTFGTDKAYVKAKGEHAWAWAGKNSLPLKQISKTWIESDYNPEGMAIGYKDGNLSLSVANFIVQLNSNTAANDMAQFGSLNYKTKFSGVKLKVAAGLLNVVEAARDAADGLDPVPGGDATYWYAGFEGGAGIFKIGAELMNSNVQEGRRGGAGVAEQNDKSGVIIYARAKLPAGFGLRTYFYDLGYAAMPLLGGWSSDDFPKTSNYTGYRVQLDYDTGLGMKIDLRYYFLETKNDKLTAVAAGSDALKAKALGVKARVDRVQLNFNVAF